MKILIIQTAFTGDVILATPVIEKLHKILIEPTIDFLLRKGNETLFTGHPYLNKVIVWDKKQDKFKNLFNIIGEVRKTKYDLVINIHRFASSGLVTLLSGAKVKAGFDKNPFSFCYTRKVKHIVGDGYHEVERNLELIASNNSLPLYPPEKEPLRTSTIEKRPRLYPQPDDYNKVKEFKSSPYICIAPASVWFTKQFPVHKWAEFLSLIQHSTFNLQHLKVYLLGSLADIDLCNNIIQHSTLNIQHSAFVNLAGKLSFLQSAALMKDAVMNYCNDSAPLHLASSVNASVTALFLSTVPAFGFGPLSDKSFIVETNEKLSCKPCGLHGFRECPQKHFKCAETISAEQLLATMLGGATEMHSNKRLPPV